MISRRLVRIKSMQIYYSYLQQKDEQQADKVWNTLYQSISQSYELYISLHCLLIAIADYANNRIEIKKNKYLPSKEELNPNTKFINNIVFSKIYNNKTISKYLNDEFYNWTDSSNIIKELWQNIEESDAYKKYMSNTENFLREDTKIINYILINIITENKRIEEYLEERSVYWNDELELIISNIIKNISKIKIDNDYCYTLSPIFNSQSDEEFAKNLITITVKKTITYDKIISDELKMWDLERIAFLDRVILHLAICEMLEFPEIPISVTIDEWVEISKYYSTEKSNRFINGIIDKIFIKFKNEKKIFK